jgi:hypothetical protein
MQLVHCVVSAELQVLQLPWQGVHTPPISCKLPEHFVHTVVLEHVSQPNGHGWHTLLLRIYLGEHVMQFYGFNGSQFWHPGLHVIDWLLNITIPGLGIVQLVGLVHVRHADEHGLHV